MDKLYQNIEAYLLGELEDPERTEFEAALRTDPDLAKSVDQHREMQRRLEALRLRSKVKAALSGTFGTQAVIVPAYSNRVLWAAAASFLLLAVASWLLFRAPIKNETSLAQEDPQPALPAAPESPQTPGPASELPVQPSDQQAAPEKPGRFIALAKEFHRDPPGSFIRDAGAGDDEKAIGRQAEAAFAQKKYRIVTVLLQNDTTVADDEALRFMRAHARFQTGRFAAAASDFAALANSFQFRYEARWNLLLCLVAQGKAAQADARALLRDMVADTDNPFHAKALELSKRLR